MLNRGEQTLRAVTGSGGRLHFGMVAGIKSERWPTSNRNPWPDCLGIRTAAAGGPGPARGLRGFEGHGWESGALPGCFRLQWDMLGGPPPWDRALNLPLFFFGDSLTIGGKLHSPGGGVRSAQTAVVLFWPGLLKTRGLFWGLTGVSFLDGSGFFSAFAKPRHELGVVCTSCRGGGGFFSPLRICLFAIGGPHLPL